MRKQILRKRFGAIVTLYILVQISASQTIVAQSVQKIVGGYAHTLAIKSDSSLWVWGSNGEGQLGNGTTVNVWYPVKVDGFVVKDAAGGIQHSIVVKMDGSVWTWGANNDGQLGDGTTTQQTSPVQVYGLTGVTNVAAGYDHSMAIKSNSSIWTCGNNR